MSILPPKWESKIGLKEPKNRQNFTLQTPSKQVTGGLVRKNEHSFDGKKHR